MTLQRTEIRPAPLAPIAVPDAEFEAAYMAAEGQAERWISRCRPEDSEALRTVAAEAVIRCGQEYRAGERAFGSYAYERVEQRLYQEARRQRSAPEVVQADEQIERVASDEPGPEELLLKAEDEAALRGQRAEIRAAVMTLPPFEKKVIIQRFWVQRSQRELAILLGISRQRVQRAEESATARLREALAPVMEGSPTCLLR